MPLSDAAMYAETKCLCLISQHAATPQKEKKIQKQGAKTETQTKTESVDVAALQCKRSGWSIWGFGWLFVSSKRATLVAIF